MPKKNLSGDIKLTVDIGGLKLKNPLITASGTCGNGKELNKFFDLNKLGAFTTKGITLNKKKGNKNPRIAETPSGILNSIGLENPGIDSFIDNIIPEIAEYNLPIFSNISGYSKADFLELADKLEEKKEIAGIEINLSCPNIRGGGLAFGTDPEVVYQITKEVREIYSRHIIVKLTPNISDITKIAEAAESGGADCVSMINTISGMKIDINKKKPLLGNISGGLSGPAIRPVAVKMVYDTFKKINIPIIGIGGIRSGKDVIEFMLAGASAVGIGTINMIEADAALRIINEIKEYLRENSLQNITSLIGLAHS